MFTRSRYIHFQCLYSEKHRGFSVQLYPACAMDEVQVRYTICNKKDQFSKKQARLELEKKKFDTILVSDLPLFLTQLERKIWGIHDWENVSNHEANNWTWVWKYFL